MNQITLCLFCGGDPTEPDHRSRCDGRQGAVEAEADARGRVTRSTSEAMALLKRWRQTRINHARRIAVELIDAHGCTHSRAVLAEMEARGLLGGARVSDYWLGAVFRTRLFRWTGDWFKYSDDAISPTRGTRRNIHERTIKVWTVRP